MARFPAGRPAVTILPSAAFANAIPIDPKTLHPYFLTRGLDTTRFPELDRAVRIEPRAWRKEAQAHSPAVLAALTDDNGRIVNVQRTYLNAEQTAQDGLQPKRKAAFGAKVKGFAIRLGSPGETLMFTEGLENAMTAMQALDSRVAAFAVAGAGMLAGHVPPAGVKTVILLGDRDEAGSRRALPL
jgi:hypothetical protein